MFNGHLIAVTKQTLFCRKPAPMSSCVCTGRQCARGHCVMSRLRYKHNLLSLASALSQTQWVNELCVHNEHEPTYWMSPPSSSHPHMMIIIKQKRPNMCYTYKHEEKRKPFMEQNLWSTACEPTVFPCLHPEYPQCQFFHCISDHQVFGRCMNYQSIGYCSFNW